MSLVVASKIKEAVKAKGMMCAGDLADAASEKLANDLAAACARADANGRKTVRGSDL